MENKKAQQQQQQQHQHQIAMHFVIARLIEFFCEYNNSKGKSVQR